MSANIESQRKGGAVMAVRLREEAIRAYLAAPNICRLCTAAIPIREGEKVSQVRRKKFCNMSCSAIFNNSQNPKRKPRNKCYGCGKTMKAHSKSLKCRQCFPLSAQALKLRMRTKAELFAARSGYQSARTEIRVHAARVYARTNRPMYCQCGYDKHVEICHVRAVADFPSSTTINEINAADNLIALCPNCHWEFDNGLLKLVAGVGTAPTTQVGL